MTSADDDSLRALATAAAAQRPLPPSPASIGPQTVTAVFPAVKAAAYVAREVRILTVSTGGYALVVGETILGVAEAEGRLLTLVSGWAKGA